MSRKTIKLKGLLIMDKLKEFEPIFFPKSIAIVGVSEDEQRPGSMYLDNLLSVGFKGKLYGVNPRGGKLLGLDVYPSLRSIPEPIDYVIAAIAKHRMLDLLDDCKAKGVKVVHVFTGGYSESGEEEGRRLEAELAKKARDIGIRIIGPNSAGISVPSNYTPLGPAREVVILGKAGEVAFVSQSGGNAWFLPEVGKLRGIWFSKVISFGNAADLDSVDFLEYLAVDPETRVIGAYLEGTKDGRRLFRAIRETSKVKPLVIWRAGSTEVGARAAASHTGALAGSDVVWTVALNQAGAIQVESLESLADSLLAFQDLPPLRGNGVGIVGGLVDGGGGVSVGMADNCISQGLTVPPFTDETLAELGEIRPQQGTILLNPVDIGAWGYVKGTLEDINRAINLVAADPQIDITLVHMPINLLLGHRSKQGVHAIADTLISLRCNQNKPVVVYSPPCLAEMERLEVATKLSDARVPVYPDLERAAKAIANVSRYWRFRAKVSVGETA